MRDEDAEQWEVQLEDWDGDCFGPLSGVDCASGWWSGHAAAGRLNHALAECGFEAWEIEAVGACWRTAGERCGWSARRWRCAGWRGCSGNCLGRLRPIRRMVHSALLRGTR